MDHTKIGTAYLNFPRRELSNGGLGFVVALLVRPEINFSRVSTGGLIQLQYVGSSCFTNCYSTELSNARLVLYNENELAQNLFSVSHTI